MTSARDEILQRIRTALPAAPADPTASHTAIGRSFHRAGALTHEQCIELFLDRLIDYDTEILQTPDEAGIAPAIAEALSHAGETRVIAPALFPTAWLPTSYTVTLDADPPLATEALDQAEAVMTTCETASASTGTIFLVHEGAQGRRALTLLPDHHICIVRRDRVVELVPEALARIASRSTLPITTISGPSATSDIEMTRIKGVHGPRRLTVILYG